MALHVYLIFETCALVLTCVPRDQLGRTEVKVIVEMHKNHEGVYFDMYTEIIMIVDFCTQTKGKGGDHDFHIHIADWILFDHSKCVLRFS